MNNYDRYFGDPSKVASCIIQRDYEEELVRGIDEYICVYHFDGMGFEMIGKFAGSWEFEEWLYSEYTYEDWKRRNPIADIK